MEDVGHVARDGYLKTVKDPRDTERDHHASVKPRPSQSVDARRNQSADRLGFSRHRFYQPSRENNR